MQIIRNPLITEPPSKSDRTQLMFQVDDVCLPEISKLAVAPVDTEAADLKGLSGPQIGLKLVKQRFGPPETSSFFFLNPDIVSDKNNKKYYLLEFGRSLRRRIVEFYRVAATDFPLPDDDFSEENSQDADYILVRGLRKVFRRLSLYDVPDDSSNGMLTNGLVVKISGVTYNLTQTADQLRNGCSGGPLERRKTLILDETSVHLLDSIHDSRILKAQDEPTANRTEKLPEKDIFADKPPEKDTFADKPLENGTRNAPEKLPEKAPEDFVAKKPEGTFTEKSPDDSSFTKKRMTTSEESYDPQSGFSDIVRRASESEQYVISFGLPEEEEQEHEVEEGGDSNDFERPENSDAGDLDSEEPHEEIVRPTEIQLSSGDSKNQPTPKQGTKIATRPEEPPDQQEEEHVNAKMDQNEDFGFDKSQSRSGNYSDVGAGSQHDTTNAARHTDDKLEKDNCVADLSTDKKQWFWWMLVVGFPAAIFVGCVILSIYTFWWHPTKFLDRSLARQRSMSAAVDIRNDDAVNADANHISMEECNSISDIPNQESERRPSLWDLKDFPAYEDDIEV